MSQPCATLDDMANAWWRSERPWLWVALALSLAGLLLLVVMPVVSETTMDALGNTTTQRLRLLDNEGWSVLAPLSVPAAVCGIALFANRRVVTVTAAAFVTLGVLLSSASIGFYFLPAAVALVLAALRLRHGRIPA